MSGKLSFEEEQAMLEGMRREGENLNKIFLNARKETADRASQIYRQYPMLQPGVVLALAKNNTSAALVKQVAEETAKAANADPDGMNGKPKGNWLTSFAKTVGGAVTPDFAAPVLKTGKKVVGTVYDVNKTVAGSVLPDAFSTATKAVLRPTFAALDTAGELTQNVVASAKNTIPAFKNLATDVSNLPENVLRTQYGEQYGTGEIKLTSSDWSGLVDKGGFFGSTTLGTLIDNWENQGSGYFVSDKIRKEQAMRAGLYRGFTDGGHAWTIGRGLAGAILKEDSLAYNFMSGVVDGYVAIKVPVAPGAKYAGNLFSELASAEDASKIIKTLGGTADALQGRGVVIPLSKMTGDELKEAHRLAGIVGSTVDPAEANKFLGSRGGRRLVERLVSANTADDVRALVGKNVYADTVKRLRDAKTELDVQAVLADVLGIPQKGLARTVGVDGIHKFVISNARRTKIIEGLESIPGGKKVVRGFSKQARNIGDISSEAPQDVRDTMNAIDNWSRAALIPENEWQLTRVAADGTEEVVTMPGRRQILDEALDAMSGDSATPTARKAFKEKWERTVQDVMVHLNGVDENIVKAVFNKFYEKMYLRSQWALGMDGVPEDGGFFHKVQVGNDEITDGAFGGPMLQSELASVIIDMPDVNQVKALTGKLNKITRYKAGGAVKELKEIGLMDEDIFQKLASAGKLRMPFSAAMWMQDKLFRRVILATGGYAVRNLAEAQMRIALSHRDVVGSFRHPLDWIAWSTHKKGGYDVVGDVFTFKTLSENMRVYRDALEANLYRQFGDPSIVMRRGKRSGYFDTVTRGPNANIEDVVFAHGDQMGILNADPIARMHAANATEGEILDFIKNDPVGQKWFLDQQDYHINGRAVFDKTKKAYTGAVQKVDLNDEDNLRYLINEFKLRVEAQTGGDSRLLDVIANGHLPKETLANAKNIGLSSKDVGQVVSIPISGKSKKLRQARVVSFDDVTGEAVIIPFAFSNSENSVGLRKLLSDESILYNEKLAPILPLEVRLSPGAVAKWDASFDDVTDRLFGFLYGKRSRVLDRSPLFRQFYYETAIDQLLPGLSLDDVKLLRDNIIKNAKNSGTTPAKFLGNPERWDKISNAANGQTKLSGTITLDELDAYAKGNALDELKTILYDASNTSNYLQAARVVSPFAAAYAEFFKSLGRMYTVPTASGMVLPNVTSLRKTQLIVEGGREADPDKDGRGFFFKDPNTQEWSFSYPGSAQIAKIWTGLNTPLTAPVSGALQGFDLSSGSTMGLKFSPGLGPYFTAIASQFLPDDPKYNEFRDFIMPFGEMKLGELPKALAMPSWAQKAWSAWQDDPDSIGALGNAVFETSLVLAATGKYNLDDPDPTIAAQEKMRLQEDSKSKGKILTFMRSAGQWLGPSRPKSTDFIVKLEGSDVFIGQAIADLRRFQLEDYDTSAQKFFDAYDETFWPYLARKTKLNFEGMEATKEFDEWEYKNKTFLKTWPEVAGYFATAGTTWEWQVYNRQIEEGSREKNPNVLALDEAQWSAGYAQYKISKEAAGSDPNPAQEKLLKEAKENLGKQYPGFKFPAFDVNKYKRQIEQLSTAAYSKTMDDNPVAQGLREYLALRQTALDSIAGTKVGIGAKKNRPVLLELEDAAAGIIEKYPAFKRVYDRVLSKELDY
jgi:hypothetical protein